MGFDEFTFDSDGFFGGGNINDVPIKKWLVGDLELQKLWSFKLFFLFLVGLTVDDMLTNYICIFQSFPSIL